MILMFTRRELRARLLDLILLIAGAALIGAMPSGTWAAADGPALEEVPGPVSPPRDQLPGPAQWETLRYEHPLHILALSEKRWSVADWMRIARRMRADIDIRYYSPEGDDQADYHVNDKWIEPTTNPSREELTKVSLAAAHDAIKPINGKPPADVIFATWLDDPNLLESVKDGAVLVVCGSYPEPKSPFASVWPDKPGKGNLWMSAGSTRTGDGGAALAGVPVEYLAAHSWIPIPEVTEGSTALATGQAGAGFMRKVGAGTIISVPTGFISRKWDAVETFGRKYDHDEIWLRYWDQTLYETTHGAAALPAYTDLHAPIVAPATPPATAKSKDAPPGADYVLTGKIVNRSAAPHLAVSVHVTSPRGGQVLFKKEETIDVAPGTEKAYEVRVPVAPDWAAGMYPVYLTVGDPATKKQFHQSMEFIPVTGSVTLALTSAKLGYRIGEDAQLTLTATSKSPWTGTFDFGVFDFRGRLLATQSLPAALDGSATQKSYSFTYRLLDQGVRGDTSWVQVAARQNGKDWGRADAKFYKYELWSMRNEYQWSTWAGISCAPPSLVPRAMRLMAHAGMNALGYAGRSELWYPAERWSWRYYNEGLGINTWNPKIEYTSDAEIEAECRKEAEGKATGDLATAAFVLASVNEEGGFGPSGWGATYYWKTPVAPDVACKAFQWYLRTHYNDDLTRLNSTWHTNYKTWDDVKLTKEFSTTPPQTAADGWQHPKESPVGAGVSGVSNAPYADTTAFYAWYYDRFVSIAKRVMHEKINPVPLTMASAPSSSIFSPPSCDVRVCGPGGWNESQMHSINDGPEPGFSLVWGHFDWHVKTDDLFWGDLLGRSGHNDYWVDIPLMFNNDLTHTRASFEIRKWTNHFDAHERIILDSRPSNSDVFLLGANGVGDAVTNDGYHRGNMTSSLQIALNQGGYGLPHQDMKDLDSCKIAFAIGHRAVSKDEADRLTRFVTNGGTLVFSGYFADEDQFGGQQKVSPGQGLAQAWDLQTSPRPADAPKVQPNDQQQFSLDGLGDAFKGLKGQTFTLFREQVKPGAEWKQLAQYEDKTPAILTRTLGKGKLYYFNMIYQSHWYIQWVTPTGPERQGFYKLVEMTCDQAHADRRLRLDGDLSQLLHVAVKEFTDPTGDIRYAILRTSGEVPWVAGKLDWLGPQTVAYDVLAPGGPTPLPAKEIGLNFKPGEGRLLAFLSKPVKTIRIEPSPANVVAGQPIKISVQVFGDDGAKVPGSFPLELRVTDAKGHEIAGLRRSFSAASGDAITLNTSLSDPDGPWTIRATDGITGAWGSATIDASAPKDVAAAPSFVSWGWPSEIDEPATMSPQQFVDRLRKLADLYRTPLAKETDWMNKQKLQYYYNFFPNTRHIILQPLLDLDWPNYRDAIRNAVSGGAQLILTGEDLGIDPGTGLSTYPHHDAKQFDAILSALDGAKWTLASADGETIAASLGSGRLILSRESIDAAGYDNPSVFRWQKRWLAELHGSAPISAPTAESLRRWWTGAATIAPDVRTITWVEGNQPTLTLKAPETVFTLVVPPTGTVTSVALNVSTAGGGKPQLDVGCDNTPDADWQSAIVAAAEKTTRRDDQGWRIIPIRVLSDGKSDVTVSDVKIEVK